MQALLAEELVRPVVPAHHLYGCPDFAQNFITFMQRRHEVRRPWHREEHPYRSVRIHAEKLADVTDYLVQAGLASEVDWGWFDVREDVARQFMFYLAASLGAVEDVDAVPVTDSVAHLGRYFSRFSTDRRPHVQKAREVILNHLLPMPAGTVSVEQLLLFKRRYGHLLPRFRLTVEQHCVQVASVVDPQERIEKTRLFIQECQEQLREIEAAMRPSFGDIVFTSIIPLVVAGLNISNEDNARGYVAGALSVVAAAYGSVSAIRKARGLDVRLPLAYVAHAKRFPPFDQHFIE